MNVGEKRPFKNISKMVLLKMAHCKTGFRVKWDFRGHSSALFLASNRVPTDQEKCHNFSISRRKWTIFCRNLQFDKLNQNIK